MSEANQFNAPRTVKVVSIEAGSPVTPFGLNMRILLRSDETAGDFSAIVAIHQPGQGPPHHKHAHQDEYFLVMEGQYLLIIDHGNPRVVGPGTLVYVPRGTVHSFKNIGDCPAKVLDWSIPGGQDRYFQEISDLQAGAGFDGGRMDEVNRRHDTEYVK
jgi:quercetin dioxygenase-like cupin family protein